MGHHGRRLPSKGPPLNFCSLFHLKQFTFLIVVPYQERYGEFELWVDEVVI